MAAATSGADASPVSADLHDLILLKPAGESISLTTPRVRALTAGGHLSPFRGRGVEFDESRPYQHGDDLRTIDWRVTARTGKPHTKVFREERNRPVMVWLDMQQTMAFATRGAYKRVTAARLAALVAWSAVGNGDQLGGLVFSEHEHHELKPRLGRRSALKLLGQIADMSRAAPKGPAAPGGDALEQTLLRLTRVTRPGNMIFLLSDFGALDAAAERHIKQLASHSDVFLLHIFDPVEAELPPPGRYRILAGGEVRVIDTASAEARRRHRERFRARTARLEALARLPGVVLLSITTADDPRAVLARHFMRV